MLLDNTPQSLPELSNVNYAEWRIQVGAHIMERGLAEFIGDLVPGLPDQPITNPAELQIHYSRRLQEMGIILRYMGQSNIYRLANDKYQTGPLKLWNDIENHFQPNSIENQAEIIQKFLNISFDNNISNFLKELAHHRRAMQSVGIKIGIPQDFHLHENLLAKVIIS